MVLTVYNIHGKSRNYINSQTRYKYYCNIMIYIITDELIKLSNIIIINQLSENLEPVTTTFEKVNMKITYYRIKGKS